jgi:flagellar biosynthetic protein FliR
MTVQIPFATLYAFLLVLARVMGFIVFVPIPGLRIIPESARILLGIILTFSLFSVWPVLPAGEASFGQITLWAFMELGFGLMAGLALAFLTEGFQLAAQSIGLQAGYSYASTIDPSSEADSSVMQVMVALAVNLLMFSTGLDYRLIRLLAASFERFPAGQWAPSLQSMDGILHLGGGMLSTGLRLALPVVALLLLIDVSLGLLGRVQQQLQLLSLAFPAKMAAAALLLAMLAPAIPRVLESTASHTIAALEQVIRR